ncbi:MAG TPA: DUF72 domain-containing protein [Actinomycetota bacterium]
MSGTLFVGTSGFAYPEWKGVFYPEGLPNTGMLDHYARQLPSVEINYTFRRYPAERTLERWASQTPEGFRFTLKANQRITHSRRLADADEAVSLFLDRARLLGERLGPILYQCPPNLRFDRSLIESFLAHLPPVPLAAMEFRHESWGEARDILTGHGVAWCVADTDERVGGELGAGPFAYARLRKDEYADEELSEWARRIRGALDDGRDVYCYMKHEGPEGPGRALRLRELVWASADPG